MTVLVKVDEFCEKLRQRSHFLSHLKYRPVPSSISVVLMSLSLAGATSSFKFLVRLYAGMIDPIGNISLRAGVLESI